MIRVSLGKLFRYKYIGRYVLSFVLLVLLAGFGMQILHSKNERQYRIAEFINSSGRQRMLSQKIAFVLLLAKTQTEKIDRDLSLEEAKNALQNFSATHEALVRSQLKDGLHFVMPNSVMKLYFENRPSVDILSKLFIQRASELVVGIERNELGETSQLSDLTAFARGPLLEHLDSIVTAFQNESLLVSNQLKIYVAGVLLSLIVLFLLQTFFLFSPITRSLTRVLHLSKLENVRFRASYENSHIGMAFMGADQNLEDPNRAFSKMLGYTPEEFKQLNSSVVTHPDDSAIGMFEWQILMSGQSEVTTFEKRYLHKNGQTVWMSVNASCIKNAQGKTTLVLCYILDITEKKIVDPTIPLVGNSKKVA